MLKFSKSLNIINTISLLLSFIFYLCKPSAIYANYIISYFQFLTIFIGISSIVLAILQLKSKNIAICILNILVMIFTLPISFFRNSDYTTLYIPLIISIISLILFFRLPNNDKLNSPFIIAIICCIVIELIFIFIPIIYGISSINNFENALPKIENLNVYKGKKTTNIEGFNLLINDKKIRLEFKNEHNQTIFMDTSGNELFSITTFSDPGNTINFINYIIATGKYGITGFSN